MSNDLIGEVRETEQGVRWLAESLTPPGLILMAKNAAGEPSPFGVGAWLDLRLVCPADLRAGDVVAWPDGARVTLVGSVVAADGFWTIEPDATFSELHPGHTCLSDGAHVERPPSVRQALVAAASAFEDMLIGMLGKPRVTDHDLWLTWNHMDLKGYAEKGPLFEDLNKIAVSEKARATQKALAELLANLGGEVPASVAPEESDKLKAIEAVWRGFWLRGGASPHVARQRGDGSLAWLQEQLESIFKQEAPDQETKASETQADLAHALALKTAETFTPVLQAMEDAVDVIDGAEALSTALAEEREKTAELQAEVDRLHRLMSQDVAFSILPSDPDRLEVSAKHWGASHLCRSLHESFVEGKGVNYIEIGFNLPTGERYTVRVQRHDGLTPNQRQVEAERQRDAALAELAAYRAGLTVEGSAETAAPGPTPPREVPAEGPEPKSEHPWIQLRFNQYPRRLQCMRCGGYQNLPEPFTAPVFQSMVAAFKPGHIDCKEGDRREP